MAEIDWTKYATPEEPEEQKQEDEIDWTAYVKPTEKPKQDDTAIRSWLKSFYTGPQKVDDIPITPQLVDRFEKQKREPEFDNPDIPVPVKALADLGGGTMGALSGLVRGADWVSGIMNVRPQLPPELEAQRKSPARSIADLLAEQAARSSEAGFKEGSLPKLLAQGLGSAAIDVPAMAVGGIVPISMATAGGEAAASGATPTGQIVDAIKGAAIGRATEFGLGLGHKLPGGLAKRAAAGAVGATMPLISGGSPEDIAAGAITMAAFPVGKGGKSPVDTRISDLQKRLAEIEQKPVSKPTKLEGATAPRVIGSTPGVISQDPIVSQVKSVKNDASGGISDPISMAKRYGMDAEITDSELGGAYVGGKIFVSGNMEMAPAFAGDWTGKNNNDFVSEKLYPENVRSAAHEIAHGLFSKNPQKGHEALRELQKLGVPNNVAMESLVDMGGLYLLEPSAIKNKEIGTILNKWLGKSSGGTSEPVSGPMDFEAMKTQRFGGKQKPADIAAENVNPEQISSPHGEGAASVEADKRGVRHVTFRKRGPVDDALDIDPGSVGKSPLQSGEFKAEIKIGDNNLYTGEIKETSGIQNDVAEGKLAEHLRELNAGRTAGVVAPKAEAPKPPTMNKKPVPEAPRPVEPIAEPVAEKPSGMIGEKVQTALDRMPVAFKNSKKAYLDWVNKAQDIDNLSKFAKDNNIKLDETLDPMLATRRKWGAVGTANSILMDGTFKNSRGNVIRTGEGFKPIIKDFDSRSTIKDKKLRIAKLDEFLQANRTVTDLAGAEKATPKQVELAQKKLNALEMSNPVEYKNIKETADRLYDYQKRTLNMLVESGIMSQESYDNILSKNKAYVPFERILPDVMDNLTVSGKLRSTPRKVIFGMKGSEKEVKNTPESIVKKTYEIVDAAETNYVNRSIAQFADTLPELIKKQKYYPGRKPGKNEIVVYEDGKPSIYSVSDGIFQGMKVLNPQSSNIFMKLLTAPKKMLQVGATATPEFAIRNLMRDQTGAMINTKVKFRPFVDTIGSLADIMGKKDIYKEYMASGAGMQSYADLNRDALSKTLEHIRGNKTKLEKINIISHLGEFSSLLETATRLGTYKAARKSGASVGKSSYISRESTLDFSRAGSTGEKVNKVIAFFNAGIQGTDRMARAAKADPVGFTAKAIASVTIPEILFQLINKDDEEFTNAPRWRKDLFWHIPGLNAWIPKPFVVGQAFGSVPGRFMEYAVTKDPHSLDNILNVVLEGFSPVGMDAVGALMPTAIKPWLENMFNYNFFTQTNLFPEYKEKLDPSERSSKFTKETFKMLGEALGMSPAKMENLFRGYTAGLGQYAMQASDALINSFNDDVGRPPTEPSNIPVVKGFVGRRTSSSPEKLNQFYRAYEDVDTAYARYKKLKESGKPGESGKYRDKHPEIKYRPDFNRYRGIMSDYGKRIDKINEMKIPDAEKRKRLIEIEKKRLVSLDKILKLYSGEVNLMEVPKTLRGILQ